MVSRKYYPKLLVMLFLLAALVLGGCANSEQKSTKNGSEKGYTVTDATGKKN